MSIETRETLAESGKDPYEKFVNGLSSVCERGQNGDVERTGGKKDEVDPDRKENDDEEEKDEIENGEAGEGDEEHEYFVGEFVWGKIRNHPWWPGQIYDPSDASDYAKKLKKRGQLLVAYFGDGSFSWCSPSQLKPFAENFEKMSKQSNSTRFLNAVQKALDEIGRLVEFKLTCSCTSEGKRIGLARLPAVNAGIRQGVLVPECDLKRLPIPQKPVELISSLRYIAELAFVTNMLDLTVLRSWMSAFYQANGGHDGHKLTMHKEPQSIVGLEDKSRNGATDVPDVGGPMEKSDQVLPEEDWTSSPIKHEFGKFNQSLLQKCEGISVDKLHRRRKRKSVAKLMKEGIAVEFNDEEGNMVKDVSSCGRLALSSRNKKRSNSEHEGPIQSGSDLSSSSGRKKGRRKVEAFKSLEEVLSGQHGGSKNKNRDDEDVNDSTETMPAMRETRKSQYEQSAAKDVTDPDRLVSTSGKNRRKRNVEVSSSRDADLTLSSKETRRRSKRGNTVGSLNRTGHKDMSAKNGGGEVKILSKKKIKVSGNENDDKVTKEETENASARRERKSSKETPNHGSIDLTPPLESKKRRKKIEALGSPEYAKNSTTSAGNSDGEVKIVSEKKNKALSVDNDDKDTKEEAMNAPVSRERKKSIYLSPPFTNLNSKARNLSSKASRMGEQMTRAAGLVIGSTPVIKSGDEPLQDNLFKKVRTSIDASPNSSPQPSKEKEKKIVDSDQINISMKELLSEVRFAAINPLILRDKNIVAQIEGFMSAFRRAIYSNRLDYEIYHNAQPGKNKKSLKPGSELLEEDLNQTLQSVYQQTRNKRGEQTNSAMPNLKQSGVASALKINDNDMGEGASRPVSLVVIFPPGFCLPSKNDLLAIFSKFGPVSEMETDVSHSSYCAKVAFSSSDDTEKAFQTCLKKNPFGPAKVGYRLRYSASPLKVKEIPRNPDILRTSAVAESSQLLFIKQKLEIMTSMVENSDGNMSSELMSSLENEMKGLLNDISTITKSSSA